MSKVNNIDNLQSPKKSMFSQKRRTFLFKENNKNKTQEKSVMSQEEYLDQLGNLETWKQEQHSKVKPQEIKFIAKTMYPNSIQVDLK